MTVTKACTKCGIEKSLDEYNIHKRGLYGKRSQCIDCTRKISKKRYYERHIKGRIPKNRYDNGKLYINSKKFGILTVLYDMEDEEVLKQYTWGSQATRKDGTCYVATTIRHPDGGRKKDGALRHTRVSMHRFLMNPDADEEVDHWNRDKLDNRKDNLRPCSREENGRNLSKRQDRAFTSRFKGVSYSKPVEDMISDARSKPWVAHIAAGMVHHYLGMYPTEEEAALAYDEGSKKYHGKFGRLNFPDGASDEILRIVKEGQDNLPQQASKYKGVQVYEREDGVNHFYASINIYKKDSWHQVASCEEEAAVHRDRKVVELGINTLLNFPDGVPDEILKIIEEAKAKEESKIQDHIKDRYIYRDTRSGNIKPFYVMMKYDGKQKRIGGYNAIEDARKARNKALLERSEKLSLNWRSGTERKHKLS